MMKYLSVPFYDGDRGMKGMNCGVLVNYVRRDLFNKGPAFHGDISRSDTKKKNAAFIENVDRFKEGKRHGSICCLFKGSDLSHVGILLKRSAGWRVLHMLRTGPKLDKISAFERLGDCLLYTSPSPRDGLLSRMPSSA